jgi:protein phosphatase 2C family protein 2/3
MKEFQNINPILKDNYFNNKYSQNRKTIIHENIKFLDKIPKKNLPELRLTKLKMRPTTNPETENNEQNNKISRKTGLKYAPLIPKIQKNHALIKKTELMFPKIKNATNNNFCNEQERNLIITNYNNNYLYGNNTISNNFNNSKPSMKRKNIHSTRNAKNKTLYGTYGVNNLNNNMNNNQIQIQNKNSFNEKINDTEKNNLDNNHNNNNNNLNYIVNLHKIKSKITRYPRGNKSMPSRITTKIKRNKKEQNDKNIVDSLTIKPLINYPKNNNYLPSNNINNNNLHSNINNNLISTKINSTNTLNSLKATPNSLSTTNNFSQYELMAERLNILHNLFSSLTTLTGGPNPLLEMNQVHKPVELSPEIFKNTYKNFIPSTYASKEDFSEEDIIKGYAYNSSMGNIRDYNEDTITATKIIFNNDNKNENNFYFFGIFDGHGGSGCSLYLKKNLHKFIKNFSKEAIREAINITEEKFLKEEALDEKGEVKDQSGSCGIMTMIQNNKCIIANVGDSRLVVYRNRKVFFCSEDHKPGSNIEKERITKAGGKIYQTPSLFPLYQNGKEIEIPWRVLPGRLSVSRTFGDVEAKEEKFGGNKNVVVALPDITEIELNDEFNFIILGCDGIFDVLSNEEILECVKIVLNEKNIQEINQDVNISQLCGDFAEMIIKSSLAKDSFDNVSCVVIAINIRDLIN